ncbi:MAG: 4-(cytidine 5'-diphospho)-2-C-methyl-D-erythritol kinase [Myxococcota bacterium]|nr:4-(cytidine 5'-diphospho)-2-C-methyl-D-erythritol kinase [Myxococcota bacterium]
MEPLRSDSEDAHSIRVEAPAKINFGLKVVGVREDGYHRLESVFVPLDWFDDLSVAVSPNAIPRINLTCTRAEDALERAHLDTPEGPSNLAHQAASRFLKKAGRSASVDIQLTKRLPAAAGLGGGSSDAGAVLRALARIWPQDLSRPELEDLALSLGADVPFFLDPTPSLVAGIGEEIQALSAFPRLFMLLANPGKPLATVDVFRAWDDWVPSLTPATPGSTLPALSRFLETGLEQLGLNQPVLNELLVNDLEEAARSLCPELGGLMASMANCGAQSVSMSGSGATIFGVFDSFEQAQSAQKKLALGDSGWSRLAASHPGR